MNGGGIVMGAGCTGYLLENGFPGGYLGSLTAAGAFAETPLNPSSYYGWSSGVQLADGKLYAPNSQASGYLYSVTAAGAAGDTGVALAEVYDATPAGTYTLATPRLTRAGAGTDAGRFSNICLNFRSRAWSRSIISSARLASERCF